MRVLRRLPSRGADRGVTATVGVALLLVIVLLGTATVIGLGGTALQDVEDRAQSLRSEQALTVFDSQAARVALGYSESQTVALGDSGGGTYDVRPDAGRISIVQVDCDDDGKNQDNDLNETGAAGEDDAFILPPTDLGALVYESGDTTMAYQAGGVWRVDGDGSGVMVSPPEFHYRGSTLTFPIIKTRGSGAVAGTTRAVVQDPTPDAPPRDVFPSSATFPSHCLDGGTEFSNPATAGRILVRIESEYATAWGRYFEQRTEGNVTYPDSDTVRVELIALKSVGEFTMPNEGGSISVSGTEDAHAVSEFTIRLRPDDEDSANFNNLQWTLYADEGDQQFEIHLKKSGSGGCDADGDTGITADATIYYSDDNGNTYHGWHGDGAYDAECADLDGDGDQEIYFDITFVGDDSDTGPSLSYQSLSNSDLGHFSPDGSLASSTLDGHDVDWEPVDTTSDPTLTTDRLVNHYFAELPQGFDLTVDDETSDTVNEAGSSGVLRTTGAGRYVTYLHVTENTIEVELQ